MSERRKADTTKPNMMIIAILGVLLCQPIAADVPSTIGGGNVGTNLARAKPQLEALNAIGAGMCRIPVSPNDYGLDTGQPHPERLDKLMRLAHQHGIEPILLFEYYTRHHPSLHDHSRWFAIGKAYAERFQPGSSWLESQGIRDWGVRFYSAINEPTWKANNPTPIPAKDYATALEGLADGVHVVNEHLKVSPGGWIEGSLRRGKHVYSKAAAPLFNSGKLHAIGIHRYWDIKYVPMKDRYDWSLQSQFEEVKRKAGITVDVAFYTDEMNFKKREITEDEAARGFLTALWDALGVVGNKGQCVTEFVMPWNLFHLTDRDTHYGLCSQLKPWTPVARGKVVQMVCSLTRGMKVVSCDPKSTGKLVLEGNGKRLWVWQNRKAWTRRPGSSLTLRGLPASATEVRVYGWNGLRQTIKLNGKQSIQVYELHRGETYMFLASEPSEEPRDDFGVLVPRGAKSESGDVWKVDPLVGDYQGDWSRDVRVWPRGLVAQVLPRGEGKYVINLLPRFDRRCRPHAVVEARMEGKALVFDDGQWSGRVEGRRFTGKGPVKGKPAPYAMEKVHRPSSRLGAKPPAGAVVLFDGSDFDHWVGIGSGNQTQDVTWKLVDGAMEAAPTLEEHAFATSIGTKKTFQSYHLHIEFRLPLFPGIVGQSRGNSGVIFEDYTFHELQVLDSYGLPGYYDECGAIYNLAAPQVNMCRPPLEWQSYDIIYSGPRYSTDGELLQPARITIDHNGRLIQNDVHLPDSPAAKRQRVKKPESRRVGRIKLQNHGDPVQYRNIWLKEMSADELADVRKMGASRYFRDNRKSLK